MCSIEKRFSDLRLKIVRHRAIVRVNVADFLLVHVTSITAEEIRLI